MQSVSDGWQPWAVGIRLTRWLNSGMSRSLAWLFQKMMLKTVRHWKMSLKDHSLPITVWTIPKSLRAPETRGGSNCGFLTTRVQMQVWEVKHYLSPKDPPNLLVLKLQGAVTGVLPSIPGTLASYLCSAFMLTSCPWFPGRCIAPCKNSGVMPP